MRGNVGLPTLVGEARAWASEMGDGQDDVLRVWVRRVCGPAPSCVHVLADG